MFWKGIKLFHEKLTKNKKFHCKRVLGAVCLGRRRALQAPGDVFDFCVCKTHENTDHYG